MRFAWRLPQNSISVMVTEVCEAIVAEYMDELMVFPSTKEEFLEKAQDFKEMHQFPHAFGAIDGKHIAIKKPRRGGSLYWNYKGFHSILLLAVVDADCKFIYCDIGGKGRASDSQVFNGTDLKDALDTGTLPLPDPSPLK